MTLAHYRAFQRRKLVFRTLIAAATVCAALSAPAFADDAVDPLAIVEFEASAAETFFTAPRDGGHTPEAVAYGEEATEDKIAITLLRSQLENVPPETRLLAGQLIARFYQRAEDARVKADKKQDEIEALKAKLWHDQRSTSMCPRPYRMTEDGCQR